MGRGGEVGLELTALRGRDCAADVGEEDGEDRWLLGGQLTGAAGGVAMARSKQAVKEVHVNINLK
eukprot:756872-Hanusia_phi.AAC.5